MPLYEYRCTACGNSFEKIQKFSDAPETECPKCGGELIRPVTAPALRFEGAGWYVNDYAGKGAAKPTEAPAATDSAASSETKAPTSENSSPAPTALATPAAAPASSPSTPST